jgi:hypothetical protein
MRSIICIFMGIFMVSHFAIANEEDLLPPSFIKLVFKDGISIEMDLDRAEYRRVQINAFGRSHELSSEGLAKLTGLGLSPYYVTQGAFYNMDSEIDGAVYFRFHEVFTSAEEKPKTVTIEVSQTGQLKLR